MDTDKTRFVNVGDGVTGPTKSAMRVAKVFMGTRKCLDTEYGKKTVIGVARMIDDATGCPDLLKALEDLCRKINLDNQSNDVKEAFDAAICAIAKADGK